MPSTSETAYKLPHKNFPVTGANHNLYLWLCLLLLLSAACHAESAVKVELCDLVKEPAKYSGQWIEVRSTVSLGFEAFVLLTGECGEDLRGIWLAYGGDEPTPTVSTVNDNHRKPGSVVEVEGTEVKLERDASLDLFKGRLEAQRAYAPDGAGCLFNCYLYDVTATFTGLYLAAKPHPAGGFDGYGHLGCCHLFVIQKVKEVKAVRNQIPAGGRFECSSESFELDDAQAERALDSRECSGEADCRKARSEPFTVVSEHWHDKVDLYQGTTHRGHWISADQLTKYELIEPGQENGMAHSSPTIAKRTVCRATEAPLPQATPIRCTPVFSDFDVPRKQRSKAPKWTGTLEDVSFNALEEAARHWDFALMPGLQFVGCDKSRVWDDRQMTSCVWSEPTAMQDFHVAIARPQPQHESSKSKLPWTLFNVAGLACVAEKN